MGLRFQFSTLVAVLLASAVAVTHARQNPSPELSRPDCITLVRAINTVEARVRGAGTAYGSLRDILTLAGFSTGSAGQLTPEDSDSALVRGYRVTVLRSQDGLRYQVSLVPISGQGLAFFSDQNGLIFVGEVLR